MRLSPFGIDFLSSCSASCRVGLEALSRDPSSYFPLIPASPRPRPPLSGPPRALFGMADFGAHMMQHDGSTTMMQQGSTMSAQFTMHREQRVETIGSSLMDDTAQSTSGERLPRTCLRRTGAMAREVAVNEVVDQHVTLKAACTPRSLRSPDTGLSCPTHGWPDLSQPSCATLRPSSCRT